jgi:protein SCO1
MSRMLRVVSLAALALGTLACRADVGSERSIYQLDSSWTQDSGKPLRLSELTGKVQILTLIYTTCPGSCPTTVKALQAFARGAAAELEDRARFLLVTVDPSRDTIEVLRRYRREMHLEKDAWKLVRGSDTDVRKLAALLGFNYEQVESGEFTHSNLVTVLNREGEIVHQQNGVGADTAALEDAIQRAAIENSQ